MDRKRSKALAAAGFCRCMASPEQAIRTRHAPAKNGRPEQDGGGSSAAVARRRTMSTRQLVALALVLASGVALAQDSLATVEVRAGSEMSLNIACDNPTKPSLKDVERVLGITDPSQSSGLRKKLMGAAAEACEAGTPKIQVTRGSDGRSLSWKAME